MIRGILLKTVNDWLLKLVRACSVNKQQRAKDFFSILLKKKNWKKGEDEDEDVNWKNEAGL